MIFEFDRFAASQTQIVDTASGHEDQRGIVHAVPLALLVSGAMWVIALGLLYRI